MKYNKNLLLVILLIAVVIIGLVVLIPINKKAASPVAEAKKSGIDSPWVRPLTDVKFERTEKRLKQGKYLVEGILFCFNCHSPRNRNAPGFPPIEDKKGSGGTVLHQDSASKIIAPNITPDKETGAGTWTDDMFVRALRTGVGHDGRALSQEMPVFFFKNLSDEDMASVVVYLRSLPPIHNVVPPTKMSAAEKSGIEKMLPALKNLSFGLKPGLTKIEERGRYLVNLAECAGCHTSHSEQNPGLFGGGYLAERYGIKAFSANITADPSGIGYGPKAFATVIRTGKGGSLSPIMPWSAFKNINDDDLNAIYAYLSKMPKAQHYVNNQQPFTQCAICGMKHGLGSMNKREIPAGIELDPKVYDLYAGNYFNKEWMSGYTITHEGNKLLGQEHEGAPKIELIPQSDTYFLAPGWILPINFVKDKDGKVTQIEEGSNAGRTFKKVK